VSSDTQTFLETERLVLRRFTAADVDDLFALDNDPAVMRFLNGGTPTPRDVIERDFLPLILGYYKRFSGYGFWAATEKATGAFLGWFSVRPRDEVHPAVVELGYRLNRVAWGHGYATEGARALIGHGFSLLGMERVYATTYQDNRASRRVMEKVGMTFVRAYRLTPADLATKDSFHNPSNEIWDGDDVEYLLTKADWERQTAAG
jgi:RimJ/RimL family protein N-acetyltransferase